MWLYRYIVYGLLAILAILLMFYIRFQEISVEGQIQEQPTQEVNAQETPSRPPEPVSAFPGSQGFGAGTPGGRYGQTLIVTNLNDTTDPADPGYQGSFRWALEQRLPSTGTSQFEQRRTITFDVGGTIHLTAPLMLLDPYVTIAGQTAPGPGITLAGNGMIISTHDVIVRGIRVRVGDGGPPTCCLDGIRITTSYASTDVYNIVVDHSSVSWAIDENFSIWEDAGNLQNIHDVTIQWNIISEGLNDSIHLDEGSNQTAPHSMGAMFGQDSENLTVHHNIFAHNSGRNPRISGVRGSEVLNNVIYNWGYAGLEISMDANETHVIGNVFRPGVDSSEAEIRLSDSMNPASSIYLDDNYEFLPKTFGDWSDLQIRNDGGFTFSDNLIFEPSGVFIFPARQAYEMVLEMAGVIVPARDAVDLRIISDIRNGSGKIINSQWEVGAWPEEAQTVGREDLDRDGIPDEWELAHGLNARDASDAANYDHPAPSGYTWLEEYMNSLISYP